MRRGLVVGMTLQGSASVLCDLFGSCESSLEVGADHGVHPAVIAGRNRYQETMQSATSRQRCRDAS